MNTEALRLLPFAARELQIVAMLYIGGAFVSGSCAVVLGLLNT